MKGAFSLNNRLVGTVRPPDWFFKGGWKCQLYFYGRGDSSDNHLSYFAVSVCSSRQFLHFKRLGRFSGTSRHPTWSSFQSLWIGVPPVPFFGRLIYYHYWCWRVGGAVPVKTSTGNHFPSKYQRFSQKLLPVLVLNFRVISALQYWYW